ncbi:MAG TPA: sugar ABC transporter ATP-binding protein [Firmicutes bacterium]|nr:sugar ABC transporter ATP-binding protein [Bacillota bacterium]
MKTEVLRMEHIGKSLNRVKILDDFRLNVYQGEILGVIGLSGSGKTTIANILAGLEPVDSGRIFYREELVVEHGKSMGRQPGIYVIHNTIRLVPQVTVAENIFVIKNNSLKKVLIRQKAMNQQAKMLLAEVGLDIPPQTLAEELSPPEQHLVSLAKAMALGAKLIVLDEITEAYTYRELIRLKRAVRRLREKGVAFIYLSHNVSELLDFADRITVLRGGKNVSTLYRDEYEQSKILSLLVGSEFRERTKKDHATTGELLLQFRAVSTDRIKSVSFTLQKGEVLGIFDIENKANMEIFHLFTGAKQPAEGEILLDGSRFAVKNVFQAVKAGVGIIPEQAADNGLFPKLDFADNFAFLIYKKISNPLLCLNHRSVNFLAREYGTKLGISRPERRLPVGVLDGLTRQKIMLYRWLLYKPKVLVFANPGAMLDVITKKMTYTFINEAAKQGIGIILVTSDLSEAAATCDRIMVLSGRESRGDYLWEEMQKIDVKSLY